jgi:RNA exonuclease 4
MAQELSSNWKRLQATLNEKPKATKRKAEPTERERNSIAKRKRLESALSSTFPKKSSMMGDRSSIQNDAQQSTASSASLALWAEDNDLSPTDIAEAYGLGLKESLTPGTDRINEGFSSDAEIGQYVAIDCEMVGVGGEEDRSVLARVSVVNFHGTQIYDSFVKPKEFVTDWRTHVSGVGPKNMATARLFEEVQRQIAEILKDRVLVGHAVKHDLDALMLGHPKKDTRDTSRFKGFRKYSAGKTPSLKRLTKEILGVDIQGGQHSSIEDARATMLLFRRHKSAFDIEHASRFPSQSLKMTGERGKTKKNRKTKG